MAFNDLSEQAQEGLNFAANQIVKDDGTPVFETGRLFADAQMEIIGLDWYRQKMEIRRARRIAKLEANAELLAQVDAIPD